MDALNDEDAAELGNDDGENEDAGDDDDDDVRAEACSPSGMTTRRMAGARALSPVR